MHVPTRALGEPVADQLCFVRAVVVHDDVNVEIGGHIALDLIKEFAELRRPMPGHAFADNASSLGRLPTQLPPLRGCSLTSVPPVGPGEARRRSWSWSLTVLRQAHLADEC